MRPISDEEMGDRYKQVMSSVAMFAVACMNAGKQTGGERYLDAVRSELHRMGRATAKAMVRAYGISELESAATPDCRMVGVLLDAIDDRMGNFANGHVENSPEGFEKKIDTCVLVKQWSKAPELCEATAALVDGVLQGLGADMEFHWLELMTKGDEFCHYRVEKRKAAES